MTNIVVKVNNVVFNVVGMLLTSGELCLLTGMEIIVAQNNLLHIFLTSLKFLLAAHKSVPWANPTAIS